MKIHWIAAAFALLMLLLPASAETAGGFIGGLAELPIITPEEAALLPEPSGKIRLEIKGVHLPYDADSNSYFIPQSAGSEDFDGEIDLVLEEGWEAFVLREEAVDKAASIATSAGFTVYGVKDELCLASDLIFTSLPVLCIETDSEELPDEEDEEGRLALFSAELGEIWVDETPIEINLRGNNSKRLPKQSYRVKIVDESGEKQNLSIAGLRSDDDWILNPMYADTSKIREKLGYELWAQINSSGTVAQSSNLEYAEVFINGSYWGLYGVQERIDRKQVDISKRSGVLYKVVANDRPTTRELMECESVIDCKGIELEFAGTGIKNVWEPAAAYMAYLDGSDVDTISRLDQDNIIDFGLWAMLTQAHDCHFKNQFLSCIAGWNGHIVYKIPWDLNNTFGDVWNGDAEGANFTDYRIGALVMDGCFEKLAESGSQKVYKEIRKRWEELRSGPIREEALIARAKEIFEGIYPAIRRDARRWPEGGMGEGNAANIRDIEDFIRITIPRIDEYIETLGTKNTGD